MYPLGCQCDLRSSACCPDIHVLYRHYDYGTNQVLPHTVQNSTDVTSAMSQTPPSGTVSSCHHLPCCHTRQSPCIAYCLQIRCHISGICNSKLYLPASDQQYMVAMQGIVVSVAMADAGSCLRQLQRTLHIIAVHSTHAFAGKLEHLFPLV